MKKCLVFTVASLLLMPSCSMKRQQNDEQGSKSAEVRLITLDPGHFHAALVQKNSYPNVSRDVYVYAPEGNDVKEHLQKIEAFNKREKSPTDWHEVVYTGPDFLERMLAEKKGNVMVTAGNNKKKTSYIKKTLEAGINVLADKPMAIDSKKFDELRECFRIAAEKGILLYDIMTERYEITTALQRELSRLPQVYGCQQSGSPADPAIVKESVHHFFKVVSGNPLKRPAWFFDVEQQGEGIVDVTTHLVDLVQWEAYPDVAIDYTRDVELIDANRWATPISPAQFREATGEAEYPEYLKKDVVDGALMVYCNGDITYRLKDVYAKVSVTWNYTFPKGGGDTHFSVMKGSLASLVIRQGKEQNYRPELFIEAAADVDLAAYEKGLTAAMERVSDKYPGVALKKVSGGVWQVEIPDEYRKGHEAHFGEVTERFLTYLKDGKLPDWEAPGMLAKYYTTTAALDMAKAKTKNDGEKQINP